ncbi:MAG: hypothetical protein PVH12_09065 [Candidatus Bathyarchaeota archaeon]|jgi:hypothetical protein
MDVSERRVIGALLLLLGVSFFVVGLYTGQLEHVIEMLRKPWFNL